MSKKDEKLERALQKAHQERKQILASNPTSGRPQLNPLVEAALLERLQFDGDAPELRTGPLPAGVRPAVPVATTARNPVAVGVMLRDASEQVRETVQAHERGRLESLPQEVLQKVTEHGEPVAQNGIPEDLALVLHGSAETDHPLYKRGHLPAPIPVQAPSSAELARITGIEARKMTWEMVATSQGRWTATEAITLEMERLFAKWKFSTSRVEASETGTLANASWKVSIAGRLHLHPGFSFVDVAANVMGSQLLDDLEDKTPRRVGLCVAPLQRYDERVVGWSATLYLV